MFDAWFEGIEEYGQAILGTKMRGMATCQGNFRDCPPHMVVIRGELSEQKSVLQTDWFYQSTNILSTTIAPNPRQPYCTGSYGVVLRDRWN